MSQIGYYRYKIDNLPLGENLITFYKNGNVSVTHTVNVVKWCEGQKLIKYIDHNGQYRFYGFNKFWESKDKPKLIGKANRLITSILEGQTNQQNIGYKNERTLSLVAESVTAEDLELLQDLWISPRVYLHIGLLNSDSKSDWIEVTVTGGDNVSKRRKLTVGKFSIDILLPEWYTISMV